MSGNTGGQSKSRAEESPCFVSHKVTSIAMDTIFNGNFLSSDNEKIGESMKGSEGELAWMGINLSHVGPKIGIHEHFHH